MSEEKQRKFDIAYLKMAKIWSENSYAKRRKVGCLIVKDNMIISDGYNGTPSGFENECENVNCYLEEVGEKECDWHGKPICQVKSLDNCFECNHCQTYTKPYVLHAEANAITKLAKTNNSSVGATVYVTLSPCIECAKLMVQSGIKRVVYSEKYRITDGIDFLERAGVKVEQIEINQYADNKVIEQPFSELLDNIKPLDNDISERADENFWELF